MPRLFLWDADGVLFQTFTPQGHFAWSESIEQDLGLAPAVMKQIFSGGWDDVVRGTRETQDHVSAVFRTMDVALEPARFIAYWLGKDCRINESVARYMDIFPSAIASNQPRPRAEMFRHWFAGRARDVFASSAMGAIKPEGAYYAAIESATGLAGKDLCLIDDTADNVAAAQSRGWLGHVFTTQSALDSFMTGFNAA